MKIPWTNYEITGARKKLEADNIEANTEEKKPTFTAEELLSDPKYKKFREWLESHDNFDPNTQNVANSIETYHEFFKEFSGQEARKKGSSEAGKEIKKIYQDQIASDVGISLNSEDLKTVDSYFETLSEDDPQTLEALEKSVSDYKGTKSKAEELLKKLEGAGMRDIQKIKEVLKTASEGVAVGKKKMNESQRQAIDDLSKKFGISERDLGSNLDTLKKYVDSKEKIFGSFEPWEKIHKIAKEKLFKQFHTLSAQDAEGKFDLRKLERAQGLADRAKSAGFDYTGENKDEVSQDMIDGVSEQVEKEVADKMIEIIDNIKVSHSPLPEMQRALGDFLKRGKIGSKEGDSKKEFMRETLEKAREAAAKTPASKIKLMAIDLLIKTNT